MLTIDGCVLTNSTTPVLTQTVSSRDVSSASASSGSRLQRIISHTNGSIQLPGHFGASIISGLQSQTHRASFILIPSTDPANDHSFASIFTDGSHFRAAGLQAYLRGARPRSEYLNNGVYRLNLNLSTSGLYADIQDGKVSISPVGRRARGYRTTSLPPARSEKSTSTDRSEMRSMRTQLFLLNGQFSCWMVSSWT